MDTKSDVQGGDTGPPRRERCDALENRRKLVDAARQLFATQGVEGTDMYQVARAAGVGQGTLYRHFADKGELCQALIRDDLDAFMARVDEEPGRAELTESPLGYLEQLIASQIRMADGHLPLLATIERPAGGHGPRGPRSPWLQWLRGHITRLLATAVECGEIDANADVEYTAEALLAVLSPRFLGFQRNDLGYSVDRIVAGTRRVFVEGLRADRPHATGGGTGSGREVCDSGAAGRAD